LYRQFHTNLNVLENLAMKWSKTQFSVIVIVAITSFMGTFLISSVNIALPAIEHSLQMNAISISWLINAFLLATAIFLFPAGKIGDLTGIRRLFKIGIVIFSLSSLICGFVNSGTSLIIFRFIQGMGAAFTSTTGPAILVSAFPAKYRGRVLGISVAAVYLGLAFGPFAGGFLTQYFGWRSIFYVSAIFGLISILIAFSYLGKDQIEQFAGKKVKLKGTVFYMLGLIALVYGSSNIPETYAWILMFAGIIFLAIFWKVESHSSHPVIETKLFTHNRLFAFSNIAALINYSATFAIVFLLSIYLQKIQALNPRDSGTILIAQPVIMAIFSPIAGRLSDKIQPRYLTSIGMAMCTIGLLIFAFFTAQTPLFAIVITLVWVGFGFAMFSSPNMNTIMSAVDKTRYGLASGSAATMRVVGQIVSMTIATIFFASFIGNQSIMFVSDSIFLSAMKWAFLSFAIISSSGIYFSYYRGKVIRDK
jgi:EmrB/QacA subfamily drug resistance transporter